MNRMPKILDRFGKEIVVGSKVITTNVFSFQTNIQVIAECCNTEKCPPTILLRSLMMVDGQPNDTGVFWRHCYDCEVISDEEYLFYILKKD